ncbi:glycosyltransferase [Flavobacterium sp. XS2P39]|uniref:glycosyltransferase n=1 Tax=Flavobacterium sp. XS2P39 TaxID=3401725 RepID=UPI003AAD8EC2
MKEILLITDSFPTESFKRSGVFAYDDYLFLSDKGLEIKMIILYRITFERKQLLKPCQQYQKINKQIAEIEIAIKSSINIELIPYFSLIKPLVFKEDLFLHKSSKFKNQKFDGIIVHSMLHTGLNISWIKRQFPNQKIILKEHSDWSMFNKITRYFCLQKINFFSEIWSNSIISKEKFEKLFSLNKDIVFSRPIIRMDYPKFFINQQIYVKQYSTIKFITVANLIAQKGYEETFEIMKIANVLGIEWSWKIIGKGVFIDRINELTVMNGFEKNITIIPELKKTELYNELIKSNIYVQLSYKETFGIAPIEGFSFYNKLIVSDKITSVNELGLKDNPNVFVIGNIDSVLKQRNLISKFLLQNQNLLEFEKAISSTNNQVNNLPKKIS